MIIIATIVALLLGALIGAFAFYVMLRKAFDKNPELMLTHFLPTATKFNDPESAAEFLNKLDDFETVMNDDDVPDDIKELFSQIRDISPEKIVDLTLNVKVEKTGNQIYIWNEETDAFLGQGDTLQLALSNAAKKVPQAILLYTLPDELKNEEVPLA